MPTQSSSRRRSGAGAGSPGPAAPETGQAAEEAPDAAEAAGDVGSAQDEGSSTRRRRMTRAEQAALRRKLRDKFH